MIWYWRKNVKLLVLILPLYNSNLTATCTSICYSLYSICPIQHTAHEKFKRKPTSLMINFTIPVNEPVCSNGGEGIFLRGYFFYSMTLPKIMEGKVREGLYPPHYSQTTMTLVSIVCSYIQLTFYGPHYPVVCLVLRHAQTKIDEDVLMQYKANWLFFLQLERSVLSKMQEKNKQICTCL